MASSGETASPFARYAPSVLSSSAALGRNYEALHKLGCCGKIFWAASQNANLCSNGLEYGWLQNMASAFYTDIPTANSGTVGR